MQKNRRWQRRERPRGISSYNLDQWTSFRAILEAMGAMDAAELQRLRETARPYLRFREELDLFHKRHVDGHCTTACFEKGISACCGFESIFTFFGDQVITVLFSDEEDMDSLLSPLTMPNTTGKCVYAGPAGCLWKVRPISCAMFFCDDVKKNILQNTEGIEGEWKEMQKREKEFTWPDRQVLFDDLEKCFMACNVDSPFMYFHKSPGLLRIKKQGRRNHGGKEAFPEEAISTSTAK